MNDFANGLAEIAKRLESYGSDAFVITLAVYDGEKKEWTLKVKEAANESN